MNSTQNRFPGKALRVAARRRNTDGTWHGFTVRGQTARALLYLVDNRWLGVTALEMSVWALRLAAYAHTLRRDHGLDIETIREGHDGASGRGWHGRYLLRSEVEVLEVTGVALEQAA